MRKVSRAEYDVMKVNCAARIKLQMEKLDLTPSQVQQRTAQWAMEQKEQYSISMADLHHYRTCMSLPKAGKLQVLAKVLECQPEDLVPKQYWNDKVRVHKQISFATETGCAGKVTPLPNMPGYSSLEVKLIVSTDMAYQLQRKLARLHSVEQLRREGMSDQDIKEHFAAVEQRNKINGVE